MATYFSDQWNSNPEHRHSVGARHGRNDFGTHNDDKHVKAFVGIVLFVVLGFVLAGLHPKAHPQTESPALSAQVTDHGGFTQHTN